MTEFLTPNGLKVLRLADIKTELEAAFRAAFGQGTLLTPDTVLGNLVGIFAEREASIWELLEVVHNSAYPGTASGVSLNRVAEITNIARNPATRSTVTLFLAGTASASVPAGSLVAVQDSAVQFRTLAPATLLGNLTVSALVWDELTETATATSTAHGLAVGAWVFVSGADQAPYNGFVQVTAVPDVDTFQYAVPDPSSDPEDDPASPATGSIQAARTTPVAAESVETGPVQALARTLTEIVTSADWDQVSNAEDAVLGRFEETDAELRARRIAALAGLGAAHLEAIRGALLALPNVEQAKVFENDLDMPDLSGRPPHSIEALVVGGDPDEIRRSLFDNKAAGITTYGSETGPDVIDSQGNSHTIKFSRPVPKLIHIDLSITSDATFPADGFTRVRDLVVAWGDSLEIGQDVVVYPYLVSSFISVPGILDVVVKIAAGDPPPPVPSWTDDNIAIGETEYASFDTGRTNVHAAP